SRRGIALETAARDPPARGLARPGAWRAVDRIGYGEVVVILAEMGTIPLLDELSIIAAIATVLAVILSRLRLPAVAGLLLAGAVLGPYGAGAVHSVEAIEVL